MKGAVSEPRSRRQLLFAGVAGSAWLAGCGRDTPARPKELSGEMAFWFHWGPQSNYGRAMESLGQSAMEANPAITVHGSVWNHEQREKLVAAVAGGQPPEVITTFTYSELAAMGATRPLDDLLKGSSIKRESFVEVAREMTTWQGKLYGIMAIDIGIAFGMAWNKIRYGEAGMSPDRPPTDPEQLADHAARLTKQDRATGAISVLGFDPLNAWGSWFMTWAAVNELPLTKIWDNKAQKIKVDHVEMQRGLEYIARLYQRYGPANVATFRGQYGEWTGDTKSGFNNGVEAIIINAAYITGQVPQYNRELGPKVGYTWIPNVRGKKVQGVGSWGLAVPQGARRPDLALRFLEHSIVFKTQRLIKETTGSFGAVVDYLKKEDFSQPQGLGWYVESLSKAERLESRDLGPLVLPLRNAFIQAARNVIAGKGSSREELARVQREMEQKLQELLPKR